MADSVLYSFVHVPVDTFNGCPRERGKHLDKVTALSGRATISLPVQTPERSPAWNQPQKINMK